MEQMRTIVLKKQNLGERFYNALVVIAVGLALITGFVASIRLGPVVDTVELTDF